MKGKYPLIVGKRPAEMKAWQDCQWLRMPCGRENCPICGRIKQDRARHIAQGENPDSMDIVLADVSRNFKEMLELLQVNADKMDIDLNKEHMIEVSEETVMPTDYPLYNKIMEWRQGIYDIAEASDETNSAWLQAEAGEDLMWYSSTLLAKIFRQLNNVNEMKSERAEFLELEYNYTGYVLGQVLEIIEKSLIDLSMNGGVHAGKFNLARLSFDPIREEIINWPAPR